MSLESLAQDTVRRRLALGMLESALQEKQYALMSIRRASRRRSQLLSLLPSFVMSTVLLHFRDLHARACLAGDMNEKWYSHGLSLEIYQGRKHSSKSSSQAVSSSQSNNNIRLKKHTRFDHSFPSPRSFLNQNAAHNGNPRAHRNRCPRSTRSPSTSTVGTDW